MGSCSSTSSSHPTYEATRGLSLEAVAQAAGVSRSALSLIERGQNSPIAVVLDKIAIGLGVTLSDLVSQRSGAADPAVINPMSRHSEQALWTDLGSGYVRRAGRRISTRQWIYKRLGRRNYIWTERLS
jgi:transcriptional regulator with XRE-family HTH domain